MYIGLTGSVAAGKGAVADFLKEKGFEYISLSNELRGIAKERNIEITRKNLQDLGNQLREEQGAGVLALLVHHRIINDKYNKAIIDGIRNPYEVEELRKLDNFYLISIDAPREKRFERMLLRNRESDPKTFEEFLAVDARDKGIGEKETGQGVAKCMAMANYSIINNGTLEELNEQIIKLYNGVLKKIC
ncbi:dephospho-CoA kinase [Candidatus Pacearchaeota archaeon]|jgi:dephospho-CoA kinase|nr:dephospho-CoA kinase [Candidatus Pacearchaeota archaeon]